MANGTDVQAGVGAMDVGPADTAALQQAQAMTPQPGVAAGTAAMATPTMPAFGTPRPQPQRPTAAAPGSFGWKLAQVLGGVRDALSDAANVGKVPEGAGPLYGVTRTLAGQQERTLAAKKYADEQAIKQREQSRLDESQKLEAAKAQSYIAHENVSTYKDQLATYAMGDDQVKQAASIGQKMMEPYTQPFGGAPAAKIIAKDLSPNEVAARMRNGKFDHTQQHVFPTGVMPVVVGKDSAGAPITRLQPTYTIVEDSPRVALSDEQRGSLAKWLNQNVDSIPKDMKGYEYGTLSQQATTQMTNDASYKTMVQELGIKEMDAEAMNRFREHYADVSDALGRSGNDWLASLQELQSTGKWPTAIMDVFHGDMKAYTDAISKQVEFKMKTDPLFKLEHDPTQYDSIDKTSSAIALANSALTKESDPGRIRRWDDVRDTVTAAQTDMQNQKKKELELKQLVEQGDVDTIAKELSEWTATVSELRTRGMSEKVLTDAIAKARILNPDWTETKSEAFLSQAKSPQLLKLFGPAVSLTQKDGTLDQLEDISEEIPSNKLPVINKFEDIYQLAAGSGPIAEYATRVIGVADEWSKVMTAGGGTDTSRDFGMVMFDPKKSPMQRAGSIRAVRDSIETQMNATIGKNPVLQYWKDYPRSTHPTAQPRQKVTTPPQLQPGQKKGTMPYTDGVHNVIQNADGSYVDLGLVKTGK